ncbi:MAG: CPBP family intramembrane glutamic endopeptidase [Bacteroidota bacterium]
MSFIQKDREENSPYLQLLMIIFYALLGLLVCIIIAFGVAFAIYGKELFSNPDALQFTSIEYRPIFQLFLFAQSVGLFLVPAYLLSLTEGRPLNRFYGLKAPSIKMIGLVVIIMVVSAPLMEWSALINQKMALPGFLKGLEQWMKESEEALKQTTLLLLKMDTIADFLLNLFLVALVAAVSEEFIFRGAIQRTLTRLFRSSHAAIWVSAFVFSAIHMQFYGFLPRFMMGVGFGYLYVWTGSLWYSIIAHFLNNAVAVCQAWYMQRNNIPLTEADNTAHFAWYGYLISFILTLLAFQIFKKQAK